jgi:hypothetical protein
MIPIEHSTETSDTGLALYKFFLGSHANLDLAELMVKKHNLFLAVLRLGEGSEKKVACPLDQVLLADSILSNGRWRKASLVQSFITTVLWSLRAIDAHWCRLTISQKDNYIPFSAEDARLTAPGALAIEPSSHLPAINANLYEIDLDGDAINELDGEIEKDEGDGGDGDDGDIDHPSSLDVGPIDEGEIKETLQRILQALDTPDRAGNGGRSFSSHATKE